MALCGQALAVTIIHIMCMHVATSFVGIVWLLKYVKEALFALCEMGSISRTRWKVLILNGKSSIVAIRKEVLESLTLEKLLKSF